MAKTNAQRQAQYRKNRETAGDDGNGERRISSFVSTAAALALGRLANRYGVTRREILEKLLTAADEEILKTLDSESREWDEYFGITAP